MTEIRKKTTSSIHPGHSWQNRLRDCTCSSSLPALSFQSNHTRIAIILQSVFARRGSVSMLSTVWPNCSGYGVGTNRLMHLQNGGFSGNYSAMSIRKTGSRVTLSWKKLFFCPSERCSTCPSVVGRPSGIISGTGSGRNGGNLVVCLALGEQVSMHRWPDNQKPRVCILGGGFGGLYTALRLESLVWPDDKKPQVLLVDQSENFVFKPMLYEILSGEVDVWEIAPTFKELLANTSVQFVKDKVKLLQPSDNLVGDARMKLRSGGTVHLESGVIVEYDWLVLALGAEAKRNIVPGADEYALPFSNLEDALKVDKMLTALKREQFGEKFSPIRVAIVGCGYSGVELAATVSERLQGKGVVQAVNVEKTICPTAPPGNREAALRVLSSQNVQLFLGYYVTCIRESSNIEVSDTNRNLGEDAESKKTGNVPPKYILDLQPVDRGLQSKKLEADIVLWTVGSKPLVPETEPYQQMIPLNGRGQIETDETLRVRGHQRIFAIGDSAAFRDSNGRILPATAQVALQQADFTCWNLWAAINGRPLLPFRFQSLGEMMILGRNDAAISPSFIDGFTLNGPLGHAARKMAYLWMLPSDEHKIKVGLSWFTKTAIDSIASLQESLVEAFLRF